jgi:ElaB/YqjD/DUF883 family membrane-anchored ribosome-binding protein
MNNILTNKKEQQRLKDQVQKHLSQGKSKLILLEKKGADDFERSQKNLHKLKEKFNGYEQKALHYVEENPKKALAIAAAAGVLAGALLGSFRKKKK